MERAQPLQLRKHLLAPEMANHGEYGAAQMCFAPEIASLVNQICSEWDS